MATARHVIVAGAGIGGLTAALALTRAGLRVTVIEQAPVLTETGAGIQLSPNASRVLIDLGLRDGAKVLYDDLLELLDERLRPGSVVIADNAEDSSRYQHRMLSGTAGYLAVPFGDDVPRWMRLA